MQYFFFLSMREEKAEIVNAKKSREASSDFDPENIWLNTSCLACFSGTDLSVNFLVRNRRMRTHACEQPKLHPLGTLVPSFWPCGSSTPVGILLKVKYLLLRAHAMDGTACQSASFHWVCWKEGSAAQRICHTFKDASSVPVPMFMTHN